MTGRSVCRDKSVRLAGIGRGCRVISQSLSVLGGPDSHILVGLHPTYICNKGRHRGVGVLIASKEN